MLTRPAVRTYLDATHLPQGELARLAGINDSTLCKWLSGGHKTLRPEHAAAVLAVMRARPPRPTAVAPAAATPPAVSAAAVDEALAVLVELMRGAASESVRADAAKAVIAYVKGKPRTQEKPPEKPAGPPGDDKKLLRILEQLAANAKTNEGIGPKG